MYDFIDRTTSIVSSNGLKQTYNYDNKNRIESYTSTIGNISQKTGFLYGKDTTFGINMQKPGYLYGVTLNGSQTLAYEYDSLSRMTTRRIDGANHYKTTYEYYQGPNNEGTSQTTTMLSSVTNGETCWNYTYDALGNITTITKDGVVQESYTYDNLNQLQTVTRGTDVWEYSYDNGGNLTEVKQNGTAIKTYQYGDSEWRDLLTSYNNQNLTYDTIGNPLQYRDGYNFTWQNGRQLSTITKGTDSISYAYNSNGLRTSKTVNGTTTEYYWLEGSLLGEKTGNEYIIYLYDDNGSAYGMMITDGTEETYYYYLFNAQGDIIGIVDANGNHVVEYTYNAWGEIISITGTEAETIGQKNPLRYRGYYYDEETGLYYVSSRYYDPEIGRFINADGEISSVGGDILGYNMFAYCMNNPVNMSDPTGNWPKWATKLAVAVAVVAVVAVVATVTVATAGAGTAIAAVAVGAAKGAAIGLAIGASTGAASGAISHRVSTGSWKGAGEAALNGMGNGALTGAIGGAITGGLTGGLNNSVCFVAGTSILTAIGHIAIEDIVVGDEVWAEDPETGEKELKKVVQTFVNETDELVHVYVNDEEIITTPEHPFYTPTKGWVSAIRLRAGDILLLQSGKYVIVEKVQHEILESPMIVYNFEVEDFHTYYVSDSAILVHNTCGAKSTSNQIIKNDIINLPRTGSALKNDAYHAFSNIVDNYAGYATKSSISNGTLYQLPGSLNGVAGRFEWIVQNHSVTHRMFVKGGTINGIPIMP